MGKGKPRCYAELPAPVVFWADADAVFSGREVGEGAPVLMVIQGDVDLTSLVDLFAQAKEGDSRPESATAHESDNWRAEVEYGYRKTPYAVLLGAPHLVALAVAHFNAQAVTAGHAPAVDNG